MCIALFSTAHPDYALILLNNRDEFLNRPTAPAHWWETPHQHVLGGRDLLRTEQGTWLGITKQGRVAVLTNFREEGTITPEAKSRGALVNAFLTQSTDSPDHTEHFIKNLVEDGDLEGVGGFSLVCGSVGHPLAVISNRTPSVDSATRIARNREETVGLSNAAFANRSWPKVIEGEGYLTTAIQESVRCQPSKADFIEGMFKILSIDTLPRRSKGGDWDSRVKELRKSIFIPTIGGEGADDVSAEDLAAARSDQQVTAVDEIKRRSDGDGQSGVYGTQKQTVMLIDHQGRVTFVERTLYDATGRPTTPENRDRAFDFDIEGWSKL